MLAQEDVAVVDHTLDVEDLDLHSPHSPACSRTSCRRRMPVAPRAWRRRGRPASPGPAAAPAPGSSRTRTVRGSRTRQRARCGRPGTPHQPLPPVHAASRGPERSDLVIISQHPAVGRRLAGTLVSGRPQVRSTTAHITAAATLRPDLLDPFLMPMTGSPGCSSLSRPLAASDSRKGPAGLPLTGSGHSTHDRLLRRSEDGCARQ